MKVLLITDATQGTRDSDFCHANPGELAGWAMSCHSDGSDIDGPCGCQRCFTGLATRKCSTTVMVVDSPDLTPEKLIDEYRKSEELAGFIKEGKAREIFERMTRTEAEGLLQLAGMFEVGTVLEKRGSNVQARNAGVGTDGASARSNGETNGAGTDSAETHC